MSYDQFLMRGLDGGFLWDRIKNRCVSHNDILQEMNSTQRMLAAYAKTNKMDSIQEGMVRDIRFLETMAWRVYMFGQRSLFSIKPGQAGEYMKRLRTDGTFHKLLDYAKEKFGPPGCDYPKTGFHVAFGTDKPLCAIPKCDHKGARKAMKQLKSKMRQEWEDNILKGYRY